MNVLLENKNKKKRAKCLLGVITDEETVWGTRKCYLLTRFVANDAICVAKNSIFINLRLKTRIM